MQPSDNAVAPESGERQIYHLLICNFMWSPWLFQVSVLHDGDRSWDNRMEQTTDIGSAVATSLQDVLVVFFNEQDSFGGLKFLLYLLKVWLHMPTICP